MHQPYGAPIFYIFANVWFLLVMSQFLIAVLCGSFDAVRGEQEEAADNESIGEGYCSIQSNVAGWWVLLVNMFR